MVRTCERKRNKLNLKGKSFLFLIIFLLLFSACFPSPHTALVMQVIDGDTIVIEGGYKVRYIGIDAPERGEPHYFEAVEANRKLVEGKVVRIERDVANKDEYGRLLRYVYVNGTFVNAALVEGGYARSNSYPPNIKYQTYLDMMEAKAKLQGRGIWGSK